MKFSEQWLREWVNPSVSTDELCHQLTMAGLEVDAVEPVAPEFNKVVVGKILKAERHPDADKLQVCSVDTGEGEPQQIICGAANARDGLMVAAALVGAVLPDGLKIKKAKLRGVESFGMLCSAKELGMAESAEGIMELPAGAEIGTPIRDYYQLDDNCIEIGLTPNRSDCLGIAGIAREVGVMNRMEVALPAIEPVPASHQETLPVKVEAGAGCPRYVGRIIKGIRRDVESPVWLQERLRRSGIRSLDPVVDVTNLVLLELGQPMHAFDLARLNGGITVRQAREGEKMTLLNEQEVELKAGTLVIADDKAPVALAGVMGGADSAVGEGTEDIFLESAFFSPETLAGVARSYGLHTDSSHRFERGVDPELQTRAIERATTLLLELVGGEAGPLVEVRDDQQMPSREAITLRAGRIERVLGQAIKGDEVVDILTRLGMQVEAEGENWQVVAPSYRFDIAIEVDLIEELARIHGYDNLPSHPPTGSLSMRPRTERHLPLTRLRQLLVARDYQEVITYSFVDPELQAILEPGVKGVSLSNPISSEMSVMRTSLLPGLVATVRHNLNRQQSRVRIFESGLKFIGSVNDMIQEGVLGGALCGGRYPEQWGVEAARVDYFDIKGDVEALLATHGGEVEFRPMNHPAMHPGQSAEVVLDGKAVGYLGALHPAVLQKLDLDQAVFVFELDLASLQQARIPAFQPLSKFPAIRRDLAIVVEQNVSAREVEESIRKDASEILTDLTLFDVYVGKGIDSGRKSLALGLTLQDNSRTLTDEEVEDFIAKIVSGLETRIGATLRV
ncbi:MAG: phenylalanine--tRNA ligase subunit beta [Gammaproteobacteria bacterium]|nr:phenylalanine--tRNA ligase subunit beta [Gammaproteobacteria bacterium]